MYKNYQELVQQESEYRDYQLFSYRQNLRGYLQLFEQTSGAEVVKDAIENHPVMALELDSTPPPNESSETYWNAGGRAARDDLRDYLETVPGGANLLESITEYSPPAKVS